MKLKVCLLALEHVSYNWELI